MVSLTGAEDAQPYVAKINTLQAAVDQLTAAISNNDIIGHITMQLYSASGISSTFDLNYPLNTSDSNAILNDIKNILANEVNILTNELGQIT